MALAKSFKELKVWQNAMDLAMRVFELTQQYCPSSERFSLTGQIRRSSRSVAANIAEAWRKRRYQAAFVAKLNDAESEAAETQTHAEIARRCSYWSGEIARELDSGYEEILRQLSTMIASAPQWCARQVPTPARKVATRNNPLPPTHALPTWP